MVTAEASNRLRETGAASDLRWGVIRGVLWHEWLAHRALISGCAAVWIAFVWILMVMSGPIPHTVFGLIAAVAFGGRIAGAAVSEGSEEFSLALPPPRRVRYLVRLALGLGVLLGLSVVGVLATMHNVPQALWGLVVESGFTEPFPTVEADRYIWAVVGPATLFAFTFSAAAVCRTRGDLIAGLLLAFLIWGSVSFGGALVEEQLLYRGNRALTMMCLCLVGAGVLVAGGFLYARKEGITRPAGASSRRAALIWLLVGMLALVVFALLALYGTHTRVVTE